MGYFAQLVQKNEICVTLTSNKLWLVQHVSMVTIIVIMETCSIKDTLVFHCCLLITGYPASRGSFNPPREGSKEALLAV